MNFEIKYVFLLGFLVFVDYSEAIIRPCALTDLKCIRYVMAANSDCDPRVWGSVPSQVRFNNLEYYTPHFNATFFDQYLVYENIDKCYVSAFFINPDRNRAVLGVTCPNIEYKAHRAVIQHRPLQLDQFNYYYLNGQYPPTIFTADFPHGDDIDLCSAYVFPYVTGTPKYNLDPLTPAAADLISEFTSHLDIYVREASSQRAQNFFRFWVNNVLCNFDNYCTE